MFTCQKRVAGAWANSAYTYSTMGNTIAREAEVGHKQRHEEHVAEDALVVVLAPLQAQQAAPAQALPGWAGGLRVPHILQRICAQLHCGTQSQ